MEIRSGRQFRRVHTHKPGEDPACSDHCHRDLPFDQTERNEHDPPQQYSQCRSFPQRSADIADKGLPQGIGTFQCFTGSAACRDPLCHPKRIGSGFQITALHEILHGFRPLRHVSGKPHQQSHTPDCRRIKGILSQTAENFFGDDNGKERSHQTDPPWHHGRQIQRQDHTGDHGTQVPYRLRLTRAYIPQIFQSGTKHGAIHDHPHRIEAEYNHRCGNHRHQADQYLQHDPGNRFTVMHMRRCTQNQTPRLRQHRFFHRDLHFFHLLVIFFCHRSVLRLIS